MTGWLISWRPAASQLILLMLLQGVASVPKGSDAPANPSGLRILLQPKMEIGCSYHVLWVFISCSLVVRMFFSMIETINEQYGLPLDL